MAIILIASLYLIDQPNIELLTHGKYGIQLRFGPEGEILGYGSIGLWNRLCIGLSYGASNLIGAGNPDFYKYPGVQAKLSLFEQNLLTPSLILGFDNQGYGKYDTTESCYEIPSKGIYCQVGEAFDYTELKIVPSLGINYSFEKGGRLDLFGGIEFELGSTVLIFEYSPNFKDDDDQNKGYMNTGIRLVFYEELFFEFAIRDLLENKEGNQFNRMIKIGYEESF